MSAPFYESRGVVLYLGDCREILPALSWDVVLTDPPYSPHVHRMIGPNMRRLQSGKLVDRETIEYSCLDDELRADCAEQFARSARWVGVFSDVESTHLWRQALEGAGLKYMRTGAWVKANYMPQLTGDRPAPGYESITLCHPPGAKTRWNGGGMSAVWFEPSVGRAEQTGQKPERLMRRLVYDFTDEGETVLDCFAGTGTTLVAAMQLGRKAIGIEMREEAAEIAAKRLEREMAQGDLFDMERLKVPNFNQRKKSQGDVFAEKDGDDGEAAA